MRDERLTRIAENICVNSINLQKGERVYIDGAHQALPLIHELVKYIMTHGGEVDIHIVDQRLSALYGRYVSEEAHRSYVQDVTKGRIERADSIIKVLYSENDYEASNTKTDHLVQIESISVDELQKTQLSKKWVLLKYPSVSEASKARMTTEDFEDLVLDCSAFDYGIFKAPMEKLKTLMEETDRVRIVGNGTDLSFSIKDIPAVACYGTNNIPDGEVFTAPVRDSVQGTIQYNTHSFYRGIVFENVRFTFKDGKIIEASSKQGNDQLQTILDVDEGSRYIGEFALGVHPLIDHPTGDILFDEKIHGSFHFTPGMAYEEANNGNVSKNHWDLVCIQRLDYGGGQIYFDDVLIRDNGIFVHEALYELNKEELLKRYNASK